MLLEGPEVGLNQPSSSSWILLPWSRSWWLADSRLKIVSMTCPQLSGHLGYGICFTSGATETRPVAQRPAPWLLGCFRSCSDSWLRLSHSLGEDFSGRPLSHCSSLSSLPGFPMPYPWPISTGIRRSSASSHPDMLPIWKWGLGSTVAQPSQISCQPVLVTASPWQPLSIYSCLID